MLALLFTRVTVELCRDLLHVHSQSLEGGGVIAITRRYPGIKDLRCQMREGRTPLLEAIREALTPKS